MQIFSFHIYWEVQQDARALLSFLQQINFIFPFFLISICLLLATHEWQFLRVLFITKYTLNFFFQKALKLSDGFERFKWRGNFVWESKCEAQILLQKWWFLFSEISLNLQEKDIIRSINTSTYQIDFSIFSKIWLDSTRTWARSITTYVQCSKVVHWDTLNWTQWWWTLLWRVFVWQKIQSGILSLLLLLSF